MWCRPAEEPLQPHLRDVRVYTFAAPGSDGAGGDRGAAADVRALAVEPQGDGAAGRGRGAGAERASLGFSFTQAHNVTNALAAIGALQALGVPLNALDEGAGSVRFSSLRGEELELRNGVVIINDCYNANPVSMRAALDHLAAVADRRGARRGSRCWATCASWGPRAPEFHREIGALAAEAGVEVLLAVGEHAADYVRGFGAPGARGAGRGARRRSWPPTSSGRATVVLVKGSRGVGLERVTGTLEGARGAAA